jgi:hypothetical protein
MLPAGHQAAGGKVHHQLNPGGLVSVEEARDADGRDGSFCATKSFMLSSFCPANGIRSPCFGGMF